MERILPQLKLNAVLDSSITPGVCCYAFLTLSIAVGDPGVPFWRKSCLRPLERSQTSVRCRLTRLLWSSNLQQRGGDNKGNWG
jgi:hypothetical protein